MKKKAVFNWSGGKDSALALYQVLKEKEYEVVALLTAMDQKTLLSSIHSIPLALLQAQADSIGIPLHKVLLPAADLTGYSEVMRAVALHFKQAGVNHFIFGDIHLHDIKAYRERNLDPLGIEVVEPLWGKSSQEIIEAFLKSGIRTKVIIIQADKLDVSCVGHDLDRAWLSALPGDVDCCGENGEYHTFAYGGPLFQQEIKFNLEAPEALNHSIRLDNGHIQTFYYWQTRVTMMQVEERGNNASTAWLQL